MNIHPAGAEFFLSDAQQTEGKTRDEANIALCNLTNAIKSYKAEVLFPCHKCSQKV